MGCTLSINLQRMNVSHLQRNILGQACNVHLTFTANSLVPKLSDDSLGLAGSLPTILRLLSCYYASDTVILGEKDE